MIPRLSDVKKNSVKSEHHLKQCEWQSDWKRCNFLYQENKAFFWVLTLQGMCPFYCDKNAKINFKFFSLASITSVIILLAGTLGSIFCIYEVIWHMKTCHFEFDDAFLYSCFLAYPVIQVVPIIFYFESGKMADFFNRWQQFHDRFETTTKRKFPNTGSHQWIIAELSGLFTAAMFILFYLDRYFIMLEQYNLERITHDILLLLFTSCTTILASFAYIWFLFAGVLKKAAGAIFSDIDSLNWIVTGSLDSHISLWLNLRQLCQKLGDVLCATTTYICLVMFIFTMPVLYVGARSIMQGKIHYLATSFHTLIFLLVLAEISHHAVNKVGNEFETKLTDLLVSKKANGYEKELIAFIQTVASNPPVISIGGYFNFDRGVNVPLLSSVATYMVIILQYGQVN